MYRIDPCVYNSGWLGLVYTWKLQKSFRILGRHIFWRTLETFHLEDLALHELDMIIKTGKSRSQRDYEDQQIAIMNHISGRKIYNEKGIQTWP